MIELIYPPIFHSVGKFPIFSPSMLKDFQTAFCTAVCNLFEIAFQMTKFEQIQKHADELIYAFSDASLFANAVACIDLSFYDPDVLELDVFCL